MAQNRCGGPLVVRVRGGRDAWIDKLAWAHRHFGPNDDGVAYKRLILSHHKDQLRGTYLIDDNTRHGAEHFEGMHIHFGQEGFRDWDEVLAYLRPRAW